MDMEVTASVVKSGEIPIHTVLSRSLSGLSITVKLLPPIEEFIKSLGSGAVADVKVIGRHWRPIGGQPLLVYDLALNPGVLQTDADGAFRIDRPGSVMVESEMLPSGRMRDIMNLSFLRLAGSSEGPGITFRVAGVYTDTAIKTMGALVEAAEKKFFITYMKPYKLAVMVCTQEIP